MRVVVVGAGIGGLTTALRLHHEGIGCRVFEQGDQIRELGVGLNILPYAVKDLAELGLLERLAEASIRTKELLYLHRLGPEIMRRPCGTDAGFTFPQLSFHRGRLQGVLLRAVRERLGPDTVRPGHRLVGYEQDADGVVILTLDDPNQSANTINAAYLESMAATVDRIRPSAAGRKPTIGIISSAASSSEDP